MSSIDWRRGVPTAFLQIGEKHGYNHQGMAGFHQQLVESRPTTRLDSPLADASVYGSSGNGTGNERIASTVRRMRHLPDIPHDRYDGFWALGSPRRKT